MSGRNPAMTNQEFLRPTAFIDSDNENVRDFSRTAGAGAKDDKSLAIALYYAVRDRVIYDPYLDYNDRGVFRASAVLAAKRGFCVGKSALLTACARAAGIPARTGFADVRNHLTSKRLRELTQSDTFYWHSYTELLIEGAWVKCTPAFDRMLCQRAKIAPLEFDGKTDSLFHPFDPAGRRHMEYLKDRGTFTDVPVEAIMEDFRRHYARLMESGRAEGNFQAEVTT
jgi:transglutaminase-like putative cysteine protease